MTSWTIPAKSFDAVRLNAFSGTLQTGTAIELDEVMADHACAAYAVADATGDEASIDLQGSLDGTNWYIMTSGSTPAAPSAGATTVVLLAVTGQPALFVRAAGYGPGVVATTLHTSD